MYLVNIKLKRKELPQARYEEIASEVLHVATGQPVTLNAEQAEMASQRDPITIHNFDVACFYIRKSSGSKTKLLPGIEIQFRDLHRDFFSVSGSGPARADCERRAQPAGYGRAGLVRTRRSRGDDLRDRELDHLLRELPASAGLGWQSPNPSGQNISVGARQEYGHHRVRYSQTADGQYGD